MPTCIKRVGMTGINHILTHIRENRAEKTQAQMAQAIGLNQSAISRIEAGERDPKYGTVVQIRNWCVKNIPGWSDTEMFDVNAAKNALNEALKSQPEQSPEKADV